GHLHQPLSTAQRASIGRVDVVMVPVDGGFTMDVATMTGVLRDLHARLVLPMHWFNEATLAAFLAQAKDSFAIEIAEGSEVEVSLKSLPRRPTILLLAPSPIP
ncbi:MAG: MBL fold metallo-hydrolase, partial [Rhodobacteraceae bacterium]|nr:MBL fold metallo-hydrolase [Paracoccaceae bacterium]